MLEKIHVYFLNKLTPEFLEKVGQILYRIEPARTGSIITGIYRAAFADVLPGLRLIEFDLAKNEIFFLKNNDDGVSILCYEQVKDGFHFLYERTFDSFLSVKEAKEQIKNG